MSTASRQHYKVWSACEIKVPGKVHLASSKSHPNLTLLPPNLIKISPFYLQISPKSHLASSKSHQPSQSSTHIIWTLPTPPRCLSVCVQRQTNGHSLNTVSYTDIEQSTYISASTVQVKKQTREHKWTFVMQMQNVRANKDSWGTKRETQTYICVGGRDEGIPG